MKVEGGKLDRRLSILSGTSGRDSYGQSTDTWAVTATTYAARLSLRAMDVQRDLGRDDAAEVKFLIRWRGGITSANRIEVDGQRYAITAIDEPDRRATLILSARSIA